MDSPVPRKVYADQPRWSIKRATQKPRPTPASPGKVQSVAASILLSTVLALHVGTGDEHWRERHEAFLMRTRNGETSHPGPREDQQPPHLPNQNAFRGTPGTNSFSPAKKVVQELLASRRRCNHGFPRRFRKLRPNNDRTTTVRPSNGTTPSVRAPLSPGRVPPRAPKGRDGDRGTRPSASPRRLPGLASEDPELSGTLPHRLGRRSAPSTWRIAAGETHYLFTVVGLHSPYRRELFDPGTARQSSITPVSIPCLRQRPRSFAHRTFSQAHGPTPDDHAESPTFSSSPSMISTTGQ